MSERMIQQFMEMVQIDSESGNEARFIDYLLDEVKAVGGSAALDDYGNLIATFDAVGCEGAEPILLSCHADTVKPGVGIEMVLNCTLRCTRNEHQLRRTRSDRLFYRVLDERLIDDRQHFLRTCLGGRQESGSTTGNREYSCFDFLAHQELQQRGRPAS